MNNFQKNFWMFFDFLRFILNILVRSSIKYYFMFKLEQRKNEISRIADFGICNEHGIPQRSAQNKSPSSWNSSVSVSTKSLVDGNILIVSCALFCCLLMPFNDLFMLISRIFKTLVSYPVIYRWRFFSAQIFNFFITFPLLSPSMIVKLMARH